MTSIPDDPCSLSEQLADACTKAGLNAQVLGPTRVRVSAPNASKYLTEVVRCMPDHDEKLAWWWSWDEPMCAAADIAGAVRIIAHVVRPSAPLVKGRSQSN